MPLFRRLSSRLLVGFCLAGMAAFSAQAAEKGGMPDLGQEEQTCLPTSTANLIVWFGTHGYPKLIAKGDSKDDGYIHTVHAIMAATRANYDLGTRTDSITSGINQYIHDAGYGCDVEYRGLDWSMAKYPDIVKDDEGDMLRKSSTSSPTPFSQDWLQENNDPNKGFILLLAYCNFDQDKSTFTNAINAGHAVTLVNAEPDMILIHDPAHYNDEPGRKILTPEVLTGGTYRLPGYNAPVAGLMLLSGSELEAPPDAGVLLTGAVCITMHPDDDAGKVVASTGAAPNSTIGSGNGSAISGTPAKAPAASPNSANSTWAMWLFDLVFKK